MEHKVRDYSRYAETGLYTERYPTREEADEYYRLRDHAERLERSKRCAPNYRALEVWSADPEDRE